MRRSCTGNHVLWPIVSKASTTFSSNARGEREPGAEGLALLPEGNGWLLAEFGGNSQAEADAKTQRMIEGLSRKPASSAGASLHRQAACQARLELRENASR